MPESVKNQREEKKKSCGRKKKSPPEVAALWQLCHQGAGAKKRWGKSSRWNIKIHGSQSPTRSLGTHRNGRKRCVWSSHADTVPGGGTAADAKADAKAAAIDGGAWSS